MAEQNREEQIRRDEVGKSGIYPGSGPYPEGDAGVITPGEINRDRTAEESAIEQSDELKDSERLPRKGDDVDEVAE
ncbi:MAG TPA: hypothetical protein VGQ10_20725 [Vicinamibacterales bacterium]|jgi:hypothetical protein|nr:hypothetical protein [Vicinamibacterales bacterium]